MVKSFLKSLVWFALASVSSPMLIGALVDTDGNAATNQTLLGDIDMGVGTLGDLKSYVEPSKISDGTNTIDAARNVLKEGFAPWYIKSFEGTTYSPYIRMTFQTYYVSSEGYKNGWVSDIPYRDIYYIGIWEDLSVVEYYEKEGNVYSAITGDQIGGATSTNITQVGNSECYIFRDSIYVKDYVGKLALTNDIPPAVAVVAPSTNATAGSAADAKATGTALYTGFTEWEFSGLVLPDGVTVESMTFANGTWTLTLSDGDFFEISGTSESDLNVEFMAEGVTATRRLITPTKTSQLTNDGPPATNQNAGHPFATTNQIPDVSGKLNGAATYPAWNPNDEYEPGDTVSHLGRLWRVPLSSVVTFSGYVYEPVNGDAASSWEEVFIYSLKQDRLPYPTNAIPYAAISGTPSLSGYATHSEVNAAAKDGTNYTDSIAQSIKRITDGINVINSDRTVTVANYTFGDWSYTRSDDNYDIDGLPVWVTSEEELGGRSGWDGMGWYAYSGSSVYIISSNSNATNLVKDIEGTIFTFSREVTSVSTAGDTLALESDLGGYLPVSQNGGISFNNSRLALIGGDEDFLEPQLSIGGGHYAGGSLVVNDNYDSNGGITISGASQGASRGSIRVNGVDILETIDRAVETNSMQDTAISAKQDKLPYETNSIPYAVISGTPNLSLYQTKLPYPTNAIPYSSISGTPNLSVYAMHTDVSNAATASTNYTDMAVSNKLDASSAYQQWSSSESYLRGEVVSYAGKLWKANAPLEPGDSPPSSNNVEWLPTTVDSQKQDRLPYPTNSIPYSVITGAPTVDLTPATNYVDRVTNSLMTANGEAAMPPFYFSSIDNLWFFNGHSEYAEEALNADSARELTDGNTGIFYNGRWSVHSYDEQTGDVSVSQLAYLSDISYATNNMRQKTDMAVYTNGVGFSDWKFSNVPQGMLDLYIIRTGSLWTLYYTENGVQYSTDEPGSDNDDEIGFMVPGGTITARRDFLTNKPIANGDHLVTSSNISNVVRWHVDGGFSNLVIGAVSEGCANSIVFGDEQFTNSVKFGSAVFGLANAGDDYAAIFGYDNSIGRHSTAFGIGISAGDFSSVFGEQNTVGSFSSGFGLGITADSYSLVIGEDFVSEFGSIGIGFTGSMGAFSFSIGQNNFIGDHSLALGSGNSAGEGSIALGSSNILGTNSFSLGSSNNAEYKRLNYIFGTYNNSSSDEAYMMGVGHNAGLEARNSIMLGTTASATNQGAFVWNYYPTNYQAMSASEITALPKYQSHGVGSFNINPIGGIDNFWIGETNLSQHVENKINIVIPTVRAYVDAKDYAVANGATNYTDSATNTLYSQLVALSNRVAALEAQLANLENILHEINTGTNLVNNANEGNEEP